MKIPFRLSSSLLLLLLSCGSPKDSVSSVAEARDESLDGVVFEAACNQITAGTAYASNPAQKASAVLTLNMLKQRYAALPHDGVASDACAGMYKAWEGRKLDLAHVGKVSLLLIGKLYGVSELDVSGDEIDDAELLFFNNPSTGQYMQIHEKLQSLNLANNLIKGEAEGRLDYAGRFLALQRLDLSGNKLTTVANIKVPGTIMAVSLARNPSLTIETLKTSSLDNAWEAATSLTSLDLSGIKGLTFSALYLEGPKSLSTLRLAGIGKITLGAKTCGVGAFPNLLYAGFNGSDVAPDVVTEFTKTDKDCFPLVQIVELKGTTQAASQAAVDQRHPRPTLDAKATCSGKVEPTFTEKGRYDTLACTGALEMPALGFTAATGVAGKFDGRYPIFPLASGS